MFSHGFGSRGVKHGALETEYMEPGILMDRASKYCLKLGASMIGRRAAVCVALPCSSTTARADTGPGIVFPVAGAMGSRCCTVPHLGRRVRIYTQLGSGFFSWKNFTLSDGRVQHFSSVSAEAARLEPVRVRSLPSSCVSDSGASPNLRGADTQPRLRCSFV